LIIAARHDLTVAILARPNQPWSGTAAAAVESARRAGTRIELLVVRTYGQTPLPPPGSPSAPVKTLSRLGPSYVKNRVLQDATTPLVAFVEATAQIPVDWVEVIVRSFGANPRLAMIFEPAGGEQSRRRRCGAIGELIRSLQEDPAATSRCVATLPLTSADFTSMWRRRPTRGLPRTSILR